MASKFQQGIFTPKNLSRYIGKHSPRYRSGWELKFMRFCDTHSSVVAWASESHRIPYFNPVKNKQTMYVPDFFIAYADKNGKQRVELIEVKPENQTIKEKLGRSRHNQAAWIVNQAKWEAARAYCKQKGIFFRIVTEQDIFHNGKRR